MAYTEDVSVNLNVLTGTMSGITAIMGGMSALTSSFGAMGTAAADSFGALDGLLVSATALITTFAVQSAEAFGQYEQGMKIVQTVSGQANYAMSELGNQANQMAIAYRTSIGDITEGLQTLGRAGLNSVNEQLEVLESGLQTAKLEGRNLNGVLEELIQNTAMLGGDLKSVDFGEQTEYLNTIMVGTSMTAPIDSHDISQTLQYAGGTAAAAGANLENKDKLEDLMGTVAAFAQKGVKGSMAGTALRAFFTKPASQDTSVTDALSSIGLSPEDLWENGGESMKKVSDQVAIIKNRMDALNLSTMDQVELWGKIVGPKMGQQMMKLDSSSIKDLTRDIQSASSAEELATQTLQTYSQKLSQMSEQGQLAYREFGEKVAMFLTPVVDIITTILGMLSHPAANFVAFATVGSLLAHGFQRAWAMITTVFNQIKGLITETGAAIQNINALAGGGAPGFNQSASSVELLNSKLAQTNMELAQMQARFMGIRAISNTGAYVVPLGLADKNGKLPANMISTDMQNVLRGANGRYYDQSDTKAFTKDYKTYLVEQNQKEIDKAVESHKSVDSSGRSHYHMIPGGKGQFMSKDDLNRYYQNEMGLSSEDIDKKTANALKNSKGQVHSSLMSMTEKEYNKWYKGLEESEKHINTDANYHKGGRYIQDNGKFNRELYNRDQLRMFNKQYQDELVRNSGGLHKNTVNGVDFYRGLHLSEEQKRFYGTDRLLQKQPQLQEYEEARASKIKPQASGLNDRALQVTKGRLDAYSNAVSKATTSATNFGSNLKLGATKWIKGFDAVMPQFEAKAMNALQGIEVGKTSFNEGLVELQRATGLTAKEFQSLWLGSEQLQRAFLKHYGIVEADAEVTAEDVMSKEADAAATIEDMVAKEADAAATAGGALGKAMNGIGTVVGYMGGPFMAGMMAFSAATMLWQSSVQSWSKLMSDAENNMSEAKDKVSQAEDSIKELYTSENNQLSEADQDKLIDYQYGAIQESYNADMDKHGKKTDPKFGDMYNNEVIKVQELTWSKEDKEKPLQDQLKTAEDLEALNESTETLSLTEEEHIKQLEENTVALNAASYAFSQALNKEAKAFNDPVHGYRGLNAKSRNLFFGQDLFPGIFTGLLALPMNIGMAVGEAVSGNSRYDLNGGYFDNNMGILTNNQANEDYAGSTELAPLLSADMYQLGIENGLHQYFGNDFTNLAAAVDHINQKSGSMVEYMSFLSNNSFQGMDDNAMAMAQMLWKEDPETMQKLGKQMFRYEQQRGIDSGHSAMEDWNTGSLRRKKPGNDASHPSANKDVYKEIAKGKYTVTDKNLKNTLDKIYRMTDGKLSYANILAMGQMQMLNDMINVANEQIYPALSQQLIAAQQNVLATGTAGTNAGSAANGAGAAANNAAVIAGMLGEKLKMEATGLSYENDYLQDPNAPQKYNFLGFEFGGTLSKEEYTQKLADLDDHRFDIYREHRFSSLAEVTAGQLHPEWGPDERKAYADRAMKQILNEDGSLKDGVYKKQSIIDDTILGPGMESLAKQIEAAYDQSQVGEYGGGKDSSGGGSGGGSGKDKDKDNSGTKKERVDLVLCNKKEIPKLNVNLFKKPPNFTILNKNFKLRDIKINSQDKPKAIMNAIKNGIIETQKRMDPKIIQDDAAEFDPLDATEGSSVPKGKTKTTT